MNRIKVSSLWLWGEAHRDSLSNAQDFAEARMIIDSLIGLSVHEYMIELVIYIHGYIMMCVYIYHYIFCIVR